MCSGLQSVLGDKKQEFINNCTAVVANNASLQKCEPQTTMFAALKATALGMPIDQNLGFAYILPYEDKKNKRFVAQLQFGYRAYVQLAIRSGQFKTINVTDVREGELVGRDRQTGDLKFNWIEDEKKRLETNVVGYLGYFRLHNGYEKNIYMSKDEILKHAERFSQTYGSKNEYVRNNSPWSTDFDSMAIKTVIKQLLSKGDAPMSVQMQQAVVYDQAVITDEHGKAEYVDNPQDADAFVEAEIADNANAQEFPEV